MNLLTLDVLLKTWEEDSAIGRDLAEASAQTPILHAKYLRLYSEAKLVLHRYKNKQKDLLKLKWLWYNGKMDQDQMETLGWEPDPFNGLKIMKGDMNYYYDSDPDIQASEDKIIYYTNLVDTLKEIIGNVTWRHQTIKNSIDWKKFESGV